MMPLRPHRTHPASTSVVPLRHIPRRRQSRIVQHRWVIGMVLIMLSIGMLGIASSGIMIWLGMATPAMIHWIMGGSAFMMALVGLTGIVTAWRIRRSFIVPPTALHSIRPERPSPLTMGSDPSIQRMRRAYQRATLAWWIRERIQPFISPSPTPIRYHRHGSARAHPDPSDSSPMHPTSEVRWIEQVVSPTVEQEPTLLAVTTGRRTVTITVPLPMIGSASQQRQIIAACAQRGVRARWRDDEHLVLDRTGIRMQCMRMPAEQAERAAWMGPETLRLWLPVAMTRHGMVWWPLHPGQHVILAGPPDRMVATVTARLALVIAHRPAAPVLLHNPTQHPIALPSALEAQINARPDALSAARIAQLARDYTEQRRMGPCTMLPPPILIVIAPRPEDWNDLTPLLRPSSGVQVLLIPNAESWTSEAIGACHMVPVIEYGGTGDPIVPEAARPAHLAPPRPGMVLAWWAGGRPVWRGAIPSDETIRLEREHSDQLSHPRIQRLRSDGGIP